MSDATAPGSIYRTQSPDTTREAEEILFERYRRMSPAEKFGIVQTLNRSSRDLALAGLRRQFPDAHLRELQIRLASRTLGREVVLQVSGFDPDGGRA